MKTINYLAILMLAGIFLAGCSGAGTGKSGENGSYYTQLGIGYLQKGRLDLASINLEKALVHTPRSADAHHYYALLQDKLGNQDKADKHFRKAIRLTPKDPDLLNNYGSWQCRVGNYESAESAFMAAAGDPLYRTPEFAYTNAGICVRQQGDADKAEDYFRQALQKNARFPEALYQMAKLHHEKNQTAKAEAFLYRYNEVAPATADSLLLCYRIKTRLNETAAAQACSVRLKSKFPDSKAASLLD